MEQFVGLEAGGSKIVHHAVYGKRLTLPTLPAYDVLFTLELPGLVRLLHYRASFSQTPSYPRKLKRERYHT